MKRLVPGALWFLLAAWLFVADAWLASCLGAWTIDLGATLCLIGVFAVRAAMLPWFVLCAAIGRACVFGGGAAIHLLALGIPIAALFPLRRLAAHGVAAWQAGTAGLLVVLLPRLSTLLNRLQESGPPPPPAPGLRAIAWSMLAVPLAALLLRRLPPLWFFREEER